MVTKHQLDFMDNPRAHLDPDIIGASKMVRANAESPLREPTDTFHQFRSRSGTIIKRSNGRQGDYLCFDNPRIFGKPTYFVEHHLETLSEYKI